MSERLFKYREYRRAFIRDNNKKKYEKLYTRQ
jgi:hypothetical protein